MAMSVVDLGGVLTIITRFRNDYSTGFDVSEAMCRYGPQNKIFAEGVACHTIKQALRNLLKTTSVVIGILYEDGKLQPMEEAEKSQCAPSKGAFNLGCLTDDA